MSFFLTLFINLLYLLMEYFAFPGIHFIFCYLGRAIFFAQIMSHAHTVFFNPGIPSMSLYLSDRVVDFLLKNSEENKQVSEPLPKESIDDDILNECIKMKPEMAEELK